MKYSRARDKFDHKNWEDEYESVYDFLYGYMDQYIGETDPTMHEIRWGLLLNILAKLQVGGAKGALKGWYW